MNKTYEYCVLETGYTVRLVNLFNLVTIIKENEYIINESTQNLAKKLKMDKEIVEDFLHNLVGIIGIVHRPTCAVNEYIMFGREAHFDRVQEVLKTKPKWDTHGCVILKGNDGHSYVDILRQLDYKFITCYEHRGAMFNIDKLSEKTLENVTVFYFNVDSESG